MSFLSVLALALVPFLTSAIYTPQHTFSGDSFFPSFDFFTGPDPTHGFVSYLSRQDAISSSLVALADHPLANNSIYIGVDSTSILSLPGPGRASVRLHGKEKFTHGLITVDIYHAPTGCGLWPAIWMVDPAGTYPGNTGEIDIVEYVHDSASNSATLHTSDGCQVTNTTTPSSSSSSSTTTSSTPSRFLRKKTTDTSKSQQQQQTMQGHMDSLNCFVDAPDQSPNKGCSIAAPPSVECLTPPRPPHQNINQTQAQRLPAASFATAGESFNTQGGGLYALLWTSTKIEIYFFPRDLVPTALLIPSSPALFSFPSSPSSSSSGGGHAPANTSDNRQIDPTTWRAQGHVPLALFEGCDFDAHVAALSLVVNVDLCGDWAGAQGVWEGSGCRAKTGVETCAEYVASKPGGFEEGYWLLGGVEVWEEEVVVGEKRGGRVWGVECGK